MEENTAEEPTEYIRLITQWIDVRDRRALDRWLYRHEVFLGDPQEDVRIFDSDRA